jgi:hypothetical protein
MNVRRVLPPTRGASTARGRMAAMEKNFEETWLMLLDEMREAGVAQPESDPAAITSSRDEESLRRMWSEHTTFVEFFAEHLANRSRVAAAHG